MRPVGLSMLLSISLASTTHACLWDRDTLRDERRGLPGAAEILAGKWERHSSFYYEDRVKRSTDTLAIQPDDMAAWDDFGVALAKLGKIDKAIAAMDAKDKLKTGLYETYANRGTFYMFADRLPEAAADIQQALVINPKAHFNRERYQLMAAEYLLAAKTDPALFETETFVWTGVLKPSIDQHGHPLYPTTNPQDEQDVRNHAIFYFRQGSEDKEINDAIEGVIGMIRFGTEVSPHLYAALGDLLSTRGDFHLAYRAYKRARDYDYPAQAWIEIGWNWRSSEPRTNQNTTIA